MDALEELVELVVVLVVLVAARRRAEVVLVSFLRLELLLLGGLLALLLLLRHGRLLLGLDLGLALRREDSDHVGEVRRLPFLFVRAQELLCEGDDVVRLGGGHLFIEGRHEREVVFEVLELDDDRVGIDGVVLLRAEQLVRQLVVALLDEPPLAQLAVLRRLLLVEERLEPRRLVGLGLLLEPSSRRLRQRRLLADFGDDRRRLVVLLLLVLPRRRRLVELGAPRSGREVRDFELVVLPRIAHRDARLLLRLVAQSAAPAPRRTRRPRSIQRARRRDPLRAGSPRSSSNSSRGRLGSRGSIAVGPSGCVRGEVSNTRSDDEASLARSLRRIRRR
mmetsp:Transcript_18637/g.74414  ORF Transcript_18637/g.74414 Transcript_18637/m.74414 type:complete len:334 (+) Transcript_18637:384-1385(+)